MGCGNSSKIKNDLEVNEITKNKINNIIPSSRVRKSFILKNEGSLENDYKILEKIGKGCLHGKLFKVFHYETKQIRIMKIINNDKSKTLINDKYFLDEMAELSQLDHQNLIKIYEYYIVNDSYYIIMEFAEGRELVDNFDESFKYTEKQAAIIFIQLLSCVSYLHSKGIRHCDLNLNNFMIESRKIGDLNIKLIDFGFRFSISYSSIEKSIHKIKNIGKHMFSAYYTAPEILNGVYNEKCDIWSLGVILYILLGGDPPFNGEDEYEIFESSKQGKYNYNGNQREKVNKHAKGLIDKLLKKVPQNRIIAEEALKDQWILNCDMNKKIGEDLKITYKITNFSKLQNLEEAILSYMIHNFSTTEDCKKLKTIFKEMDKNSNGRLTYEELKIGMNKFFEGINLQEAELLEMIKSIDKDDSGFIEYHEFLLAFLDKEMLLTEKNLINAFHHFDKDKSGNIGIKEFKVLMGLIQDNEEITNILKQIIKLHKLDGDREISFEEFKSIMKETLKL